MLIWREWTKTAEEVGDQSWQGGGRVPTQLHFHKQVRWVYPALPGTSPGTQPLDQWPGCRGRGRTVTSCSFDTPYQHSALQHYLWSNIYIQSIFRPFELLGYPLGTVGNLSSKEEGSKDRARPWHWESLPPIMN